MWASYFPNYISYCIWKIGRRKVQEMPQSQVAAHPKNKEEEETDKTKQAEIE